MTSILVTWIANSLAIYFVAYLLGGVDVASLRDAFLAGAVLSIVNAFVKPVIVILTLPLTVLTLGLFYFVVTGSAFGWLRSSCPGSFCRASLRQSSPRFSSACSALSSRRSWGMRRLTLPSGRHADAMRRTCS